MPYQIKWKQFWSVLCERSAGPVQNECPISPAIYIKTLLALIWSQQLINQTEYRKQVISKKNSGCFWRQVEYLLSTLGRLRRFSFSVASFPLFPSASIVFLLFCDGWFDRFLLVCFVFTSCEAQCFVRNWELIAAWVQLLSWSWTPVFPV